MGSPADSPCNILLITVEKEVKSGGLTIIKMSIINHVLRKYLLQKVSNYYWNLKFGDGDGPNLYREKSRC